MFWSQTWLTFSKSLSLWVHHLLGLALRAFQIQTTKFIFELKLHNQSHSPIFFTHLLLPTFLHQPFTLLLAPISTHIHPYQQDTHSVFELMCYNKLLILAWILWKNALYLTKTVWTCYYVWIHGLRLVETVKLVHMNMKIMIIIV